MIQIGHINIIHNRPTFIIRKFVSWFEEGLTKCKFSSMFFDQMCVKSDFFYHFGQNIYFWLKIRQKYDIYTTLLLTLQYSRVQSTISQAVCHPLPPPVPGWGLAETRPPLVPAMVEEEDTLREALRLIFNWDRYLTLGATRLAMLYTNFPTYWVHY